MNFYSEWDKYPAAWLRNLQAAGHIPAGAVDERSIEDVQAEDLQGAQQAHFFAGIGGWPLALHLAGWPESRPVWTGSCPCQPFSGAGKAEGVGDKRHLWPAFRRLIAECLPPVVFGEQVASDDGRFWLAGVRTDLEDLGYAVGSSDLCAASVGAPHPRQRLWWVADTHGRQPGDGRVQRGRQHGQQPEDGFPAGGLGDAGREGLEGGEFAVLRGAGRREEGRAASQPGQAQGHWDAYDLIPCRDGKARRVEPGVFPLAHGVPGRVGKLRAYGNAIVPQVAARFVKAYMEARGIVA